MEKQIINLAKKDYEIKIDFELSYDLTKYRNKLEFGIDFSDADKDMITEIIEMRKKMENGTKIEELDLSSLSNETIEYLEKKSIQKRDVFSKEELIDIGKKLTKVENEDEIKEIYNEEIKDNGYDVLIAKLSSAVSMVFMNAKDGSTEQ